jgi:single-strand DNA-binding protein
LGCVSHTTTTTSKEVFQMNSVNITGRLTQDPELRALPSGESVCKLRLAVEGMSAGGETGYVNVAAFGKPGEAAARVLAKGWLVAVVGRLSYRAWEADDGAKRHDYEVVGNVEFLAAPRGNGASPASEREKAVAS